MRLPSWTSLLLSAVASCVVPGRVLVVFLYIRGSSCGVEVPTAGTLQCMEVLVCVAQ